MDGAQLSRWRDKHGYSQSRLATRLGVDVMTVSRWERGIYPIAPYLHLALAQIATVERTKKYQNRAPRERSPEIDAEPNATS